LVLIVFVLVHQKTCALLQSFLNALLNDSIATDIVILTVWGVLVLADFLRLSSHIVSFCLVTGCYVCKISKEKVLILQKAELARHLVLYTVGRGSLATAWIATQRPLVPDLVAVRVEQVTRLLLEQVECTIVVFINWLQKTVNSVLVFIFKGLLKCTTLVFS